MKFSGSRLACRRFFGQESGHESKSFIRRPGQSYNHIDPASITRAGDRRTFNSALDYRSPQTSSTGKSYQSVESQFQVNCRMKMARIVHMTYYSGPMLTGSVVERQGMLYDWMEVDPTSPVHRLVQ